jgi:polysaccharide export outer membrane protein
MKRCLKRGCGLLAVCGLGLALLPSAPPLAQERQDQERIEPTPQSVDLPQQDTSPAVPLAPEAPALSADYVIGPEDVLDIDIFDVPELSKTVRVANDGTISLALLGHVRAAGLTTTQLREELESKWSQTYLENPQVSVFVREFHAQPVSLIGAVEKPGLYQLTAPRTLIEVLSMAGGLAKRTTAPAGRTLIVTRKEGFGDLQPVEGMRLVAPDKLEIQVRKLLYSRESALNIEIKPLDTISVSKADIVYVMGDVKRPTGILMEDRETLTVLQALAVAEGLNRTASKKGARIIRKMEDGTRMEIPVNLDKVLKGKEQDIELAANDVLFVPDSKGKYAVFRGIEATIATVSGVIIWGAR